MIALIKFLNHLSDIAIFSYIVVDKANGQISHQKNLTNHQLTAKQIQRIITQTSIIHNYYFKEQKLLLFAYDTDELNQLVCLFIDDEVGNFISHNDRLLKISETIHLFMKEKEFTAKEVQSLNQNILYLRETIIEKILSEQIEQQLYHHDFESEEAMFLEVMNGNEEAVKRYYYAFQQNSQTGILSTESELRNQKNILIVAVAVSTRYAIKGGVPYERAYTLSDNLIQDIERKDHFSGTQPPILEILLLFCKEVRKYNYIKYSTTVKKTCEFIHKNIYSNVSIPMIAAYANYSVPHLSKLFKKEVGLSLNQYVMKQKIEESKRLLEFKQYDLNTISSLLHFNDASYFIKVFKKYEHMTPKSYWHEKN
ncbi:hypothetical protein UAY_00050 [Enterococcus moraviensis ATCC BAA-383]|uniref:HTH araC/xylS-type domain-containing protein n=1 Tax=Enterococcus moraviensis ATCC BAA-383 TaxID=1158609 RepID=R2THQ1_9ENTE|nr:helix-turn-helix domain-containing protein [Enterococcus moraviensis]EOI06708.1 hypothetical protein UAY_00050 [Enterococcus moraviensis ATCC BAA-383]EOT65045.1 hypothetical protein I586_02779 [Enterococcus moraviensis ATCC BAA-383]